MTLTGLSKEQLEYIMQSITRNPNEWNSEIRPLKNYREELRSWIRLQYTEQLKGGAWRRRLREQGYTA